MALLKTILMDWTNDEPFVLVIDEIQAWATPSGWVRKRGQETVHKEDYANYYVVALTQAIAALVSQEPRFKILILGTDLLVGHTVRIASEVRIFFFFFFLTLTYLLLLNKYELTQYI